MKIAFIIPWFGKDLRGGAEFMCRETALHLKEKGIDVEILTTCSKSHNDEWTENHYKPGIEKDNSLIVRRFLVDKRDANKFNEINLKLISLNKKVNSNQNPLFKNGIRVSPISFDEEAEFFKNSINSEALINYLKVHSQDYELFCFIPYLFGLIVNGMSICQQRSILIPCLHNEGYAYLDIIHAIFNKAKAVFFNAASEMNLAQKLYGFSNDHNKFFNLGVGVNYPSEKNKDNIINEIKIPPFFLLYIGRKSPEKNLFQLIDYFKFYKSRNSNSLKLVIIGSGQSISQNNNILDLGMVSDDEKYRALNSAYLLCNPSKNESFSFVIMEAWLKNKPVLIHEDCDVTLEHCQSSNGGLWYRNYYEFEETMNYLLTNKAIASQMGQNGKQYVLSNYTWEIVTEKYIKTIMKLINE